MGAARTALIGPTAGWRPARTRLEQDGLLPSERDVDPRGTCGLCVVLFLGIGFGVAEGMTGSPGCATVSVLALIALVPRLFTRPLAAQTVAGRARISTLRRMPPTVQADSAEDVPTRIAVFGPEAVPDPIVRARP
ncbi:hypothetical protein [Embleya sp. NPDC005971]|uniref:hypothetical protein n=1 Tax=Embleya sp. NPDC005971 TaxID=3156724 RepID=UPI0033C52E90